MSIETCHIRQDLQTQKAVSSFLELVSTRCSREQNRRMPIQFVFMLKNRNSSQPKTHHFRSLTSKVRINYCQFVPCFRKNNFTFNIKTVKQLTECSTGPRNQLALKCIVSIPCLQPILAFPTKIILRHENYEAQFMYFLNLPVKRRI